MIKKFFTFMMAAGVLLATSCSHDDLDTVQSGNEAQVTFSLSLEGGIATRAISDGSQADKLVYAVFDENGGRISTIQKIERTDVTFPATETLTLAKGQTYKIAFWAQDADCEAYTIDDNMNVTVSYENALNNDETRIHRHRFHFNSCRVETSFRTDQCRRDRGGLGSRCRFGRYDQELFRSYQECSNIYKPTYGCGKRV